MLIDRYGDILGAVFCFVMLVTVYQATSCNIPEDSLSSCCKLFVAIRNILKNTVYGRGALLLPHFVV